ncbi:hypothetical protein MAR_029705 [Mya arenaria]|uniref:Uncharacterized protein n=1 Tax=Mya arenaria TaxID=6604 RepID=A0ABY7DKY4_MYAAR|nr:hypothetical protein MAR_029705 [Mya arenaria]
MGSVLSVTPMSDHLHWFVYVTSATMGHTRAGV